jgi:cyanate permease
MANFDINLIKAPLPGGLEPYQTGYRWVMLALIWLLYFTFGVIMSLFAPLVTPILRDLNISYSQMGIILGAYPITYIVIAVIGGAIIDRWGIRKSLFIGVLIIGLSAVLRYFVNGFTTLFLCAALFGLGGPMVSIGSPKTIATWFRGKERAIAVGVYTTGPTVGRLFVLSLTNSVIMPLTGYSWRMTFVLFSFIAFASALTWWFFSRDVKSARNEGNPGILKVFTDLIKIRKVQLILFLGFLNMAIGGGFSNWLPKLLENGGLSPEIAGFAASIPIVAGIPAVLIIPRLTPPRLRGRVVVISSVIGAIVLYVIGTTSGGLLISGLVFFGLARQCIMPLLMLMLMDFPEVGSRYMGSAGGMYFCIAEMGGFVGPYMIGATVDLTGNFVVGMGIMSVLSILMVVMALFIKTQPASNTSDS